MKVNYNSAECPNLAHEAECHYIIFRYGECRGAAKLHQAFVI